MIENIIAKELNVDSQNVMAAINLLDQGDTVPFISRYRKEVTGNLDDTQMRYLHERLNYLRELNERRDSILNTISEQGKLTDELKQKILEAESKVRLEDLYKPFMVKRRTKAQIAREAGLQNLADDLFQNHQLDPKQEAQKYISTDVKLEAEKLVADVDAALAGAKFILMEQYSENAELLAMLRDYIQENAFLVSSVITEKEKQGQKFSDYFDYSEKLKDIPSHRALALFRGAKEGVLSLQIQTTIDQQSKPVKKSYSELDDIEIRIANYLHISTSSTSVDKANDWLLDTVRWAWRSKLKNSLDLDAKSKLRESAETSAIDVFAANLKDLLMAAPAGHKVTIGLDPGLRTGVKVIVVDETGKHLDSATIYPHAPKNQWEQSLSILEKLVLRYDVNLISIGNGTASRETDKLAGDLIKRVSKPGLTKVIVSEAGASVYSASELAAQEFPAMDVSLRGAVSIARRLQDPLAELVKIDPKAIGVGQYQHDVNQVKLVKSLDNVVEDCVNAVGVDLNTASPSLLKNVAGLSSSVAANIVAYREENGVFNNRKELKKIPRLGDKAYKQCAGFLRIRNGDNPLDNSGVHPESYPLVKKILEDNNTDIQSILGNVAVIEQLNPKNYSNQDFGLYTVNDILDELKKPGRDPRPQFKTASFKEGVEKISDLEADMILEGTITNVTDFGAFVDIGVHQDGLVHISQLANKFVKDPRSVVKTGDIVKVKVTEIDIARKRIALTMRLEAEGSRTGSGQLKSKDKTSTNRSYKKPTGQIKNTAPSSYNNRADNNMVNNAMADALKKAIS
ncbi:MAG: RNA-binding transcriptional accessory protein [Gammaproteobacteria bacterium]|nr:RNA-binding transcriptional accessory protein [Gammaproteobacteria bacterium]